MLNKVFLVGRLGADPEIRYTKNGDPVANFRLATSERWKDQGSGQYQEQTEWHNVVAFKGKADAVQGHLSKGSLVLIEGRLKTRTWTDNQNVKHYRTEIVANVITFLDRKASGNSNSGSDSADEDIPF